MAERIQLVFVASTGRSGTTLLELLLGAHDPIATMGEIHIWPHEIARTGRTMPCGCGLEVPDCPFWKAMKGRVDPLGQPAPRIDHFREKHDGGRTLRPGQVPGFWLRDRRQDEAAVATYGANNEAVFRAFSETFEEFEGTRPRWLVDASKDPYRLIWLVDSGLFDITVLHVTKDPRSYVFSQGRGLWQDPDDSREMVFRRIRLATRKSGNWLVVNQLIGMAARRRLPASRYLHVRYEDLAAAPERVMGQICATIGCPFDPDVISAFRQRQTHSIAGNGMRHDTRPIVFDEKWRSGLPDYAQRLTSVLTAPLRPRLGY